MKPLIQQEVRALRTRWQNQTLGELIEERVVPVPECGCWLLPSALGVNFSARYGMFCIGKEEIRANRASYAWFKGDIPEGIHVLHKCDTPACVNPDHLFLGTHQDNMQDCKIKKRFNTPRGPRATAPKNAIRLEYRGESKTLAEWAEQLGIEKNALYYRVFKLGWTVEEALQTKKVKGRAGRPLKHLSYRNEPIKCEWNR